MPTPLIASRRNVVRKDLADVVEKVWVDETGVVIVLLYDRPEFERYTKGCLKAWQDDCYEGYLFNEEKEVRWRLRRDDCFTMVAAYDDGTAPPEGFEVMPDCASLQLGGVQPYLWGTQLQPGVWFEQRIPRKLCYPTVPRQRVRLEVRQYLDDTQRPIYARFVKLT